MFNRTTGRFVLPCRRSHLQTRRNILLSDHHIKQTAMPSVDVGRVTVKKPCCDGNSASRLCGRSSQLTVTKPCRGQSSASPCTAIAIQTRTTCRYTTSQRAVQRALRGRRPTERTAAGSWSLCRRLKTTASASFALSPPYRPLMSPGFWPCTSSARLPSPCKSLWTLTCSSCPPCVNARSLLSSRRYGPPLRPTVLPWPCRRRQTNGTRSCKGFYGFSRSASGFALTAYVPMPRALSRLVSWRPARSPFRPRYGVSVLMRTVLDWNYEPTADPCLRRAGIAYLAAFLEQLMLGLGGGLQRGWSPAASDFLRILAAGSLPASRVSIHATRRRVVRLTESSTVSSPNRSRSVPQPGLPCEENGPYPLAPRRQSSCVPSREAERTFRRAHLPSSPPLRRGARGVRRERLLLVTRNPVRQIAVRKRAGAAESPAILGTEHDGNCSRSFDRPI